MSDGLNVYLAEIFTIRLKSMHIWPLLNTLKITVDCPLDILFAC